MSKFNTRKSWPAHLLSGLLFLVLSQNIEAQAATSAQKWDRPVAFSLIQQADTDSILRPLFKMAHSGRNPELLDALSLIEQDTETPPPLKDFIFFNFAVGLSDLDANAVNSEVLDFLAGYEAKTMVAHIDHPRMNEPLYNVKAATAGVRSRWARLQAFSQAASLLQEQPSRWISGYVAADRTGRMGFVDVLNHAPVESVNQLGWSALTLLDEQPGLTPVVARAGLATDDLELIQNAITHGGGPDLSRVLAAAAPVLNDLMVVDLLNEALHSAEIDKAALLIAWLAPDRLSNPVVADMMFDTLADQDLGGSAALILSKSQRPDIQGRLNEIASGKAGLSRQRARLAVGIRQADQEAGS